MPCVQTDNRSVTSFSHRDRGRVACLGSEVAAPDSRQRGLQNRLPILFGGCEWTGRRRYETNDQQRAEKRGHWGEGRGKRRRTSGHVTETNPPRFGRTEMRSILHVDILTRVSIGMHLRPPTQHPIQSSIMSLRVFGQCRPHGKIWIRPLRHRLVRDVRHLASASRARTGVLVRDPLLTWGTTASMGVPELINSVDRAERAKVQLRPMWERLSCRAQALIPDLNAVELTRVLFSFHRARYVDEGLLIAACEATTEEAVSCHVVLLGESISLTQTRHSLLRARCWLCCVFGRFAEQVFTAR